MTTTQANSAAINQFLVYEKYSSQCIAMNGLTADEKLRVSEISAEHGADVLVVMEQIVALCDQVSFEAK